LHDLLDAVAHGLEGVLRQAYTSLVLYDRERPGWRLHALHFPGGKGHLRAGQDVPFANAPATRVYETRRPVVFNRADLDALGSDISRRLLAEGLQSFCSVPLLVYDRFLGTLNVGRTDERTFSPDDVDLLVQVAGQVALVVQNALAFGQVRDLRDTLAREKTYLESEIRNETTSRTSSEPAPAFGTCLSRCASSRRPTRPFSFRGKRGPARS
jgi:formate hydrogenlyase transcriptional activator